jgi:acyl-CoA reductase-like NAD-dependent aldehyde dehydrogenase
MPDTAHLDLIIDSASIKAVGGRTFERLNPVTGEVATIAAAASVADAQSAADAAAAAFPVWSSMGPNARRAVLLKVADELAALTPDFIKAMQEETGATQAWAGFNCMLAANMMREAASLTTLVAGETIPSDKPGCLSLAMRQPAGVVLGIAPWNAPVILGVRAIATPLACGNTVVLKAAEACPRVHWLIAEAFRRAGAPKGIISLVTNAPEDAANVVGALIDHPAVKRINFTGSTHVGRIIAVRAAQQLKPCLLELGGKAPMLVLEAADLDEAVKAAAFGAFMNQGQICMSTERIIVVDAVAEAFVEKFAAKAATMPAGGEGNTPLGSVVDLKSADKVRELMTDAVSKGAKLIAGGDGEGVLIPASVLDGVTPDMRIYGEESFGPVVSIVRAKDTDDAIRIANDTEYGLTASVFTTNIAEAFSVAARIQSGMCHINGATVHDEAQMPFGGVKASGYGRFGGKAGINEFTDLRWITVETLPGHFPI